MPIPQEKKFLHALLLTGLEYDALKKIRAAFPSYEAAWRAGRGQFQGAGFDEERVTALESAQKRLNPDEEMRKLVNAGITLVSNDDPEYPKELINIAASPAFLYIKGRLDLERPRLAVVGTRKATSYGREVVRKIISDLARETDLAIVSGLAQGIDTEAHRAALDAGLVSMGILGGGMSRSSFFPPENWRLAEELETHRGAVISEYPPDAPALPHHFPARNRIIAGLSLGTLVVEAPEKSGALITASFALEQGREVFAIPSPLFSQNAAGTHRLIQDGAKLVHNARDIIEELALETNVKHAPTAAIETSSQGKALLEFLTEPRSIDELREHTRLATAEIMTTLSSLELQGVVKSIGQNRFLKISG